MKITEIKTFLVDATWRNWVLVKVETDDGIHGWGEASMEMNEDVAPEAAVLRMADYFIGKDPRTIELHWHTVYRDTWYHPCYVIQSALAAIEIALWDILGKSLNAPVYQLLGGACHPRVRAYANGWYSKAKQIEDYGKLAQDAAAFGFKHIKIDPFWPSDLYGEPDEITRPREIIRTIREAVGADIHILVEGHGRFTAKRAIQIARALEEYDPYFFEDPVPPENIDILAEVTTSINTPVCSGERTCTHWEAREILAKKAVSIFQPDIIHIGGISETRKVAAMASAHYIPISLHNPNGPVQTAASIHIGAATRNFLFTEFFYPDLPIYEEILIEPLVFSKGAFDLPARPGLGVDFNEDALLKRPPKRYRGVANLYDANVEPGSGSGY
jgi:galactonate dehydratase